MCVCLCDDVGICILTSFILSTLYMLQVYTASPFLFAAFSSSRENASTRRFALERFENSGVIGSIDDS